ncbi:hypothetical protein SDC9_56154 [bioreactor metagenome]|uniref:Uncharacterized protein n=1 Tax=bioreactor metagenome TaxID=1076179 RepID=A0A644X1S2_9ZZZZ
MSVVIGIIMDGTVLLAADQRMVNLDTGKIASETFKKIFAINEHLAISVVGNAGLSAGIFYSMREFNKNQNPSAIKNAFVDEYCSYIDRGIEIMQETIDITSNDLSCTIIVAGKTKSGVPVVKYRAYEEPMWACQAESKAAIVPIIFNPSDTSKEKCLKILQTSINRYREKSGGMIEILFDTIKRISAVSSSVNDNIDVWLCDAATIIN